MCVRGSRRNTIATRRFPYLRLAISDNKICLTPHTGGRCAASVDEPPSLPPGASIDYEIALDKANEILARWAWSVVPSCCALVSTYHWDRPVGYLSDRIGIPMLCPSSTQVRTLYLATSQGICMFIPYRAVLYVARIRPSPTAEDSSSSLIAIRLYLVLYSKLQYVLSCAPCHAAASL